MLYLKDIHKHLPTGVQILVFADDIYIYYAAKSFDRVIAKLQDALITIQAWCTEWKMAISPSKSATINFSNKRLSPTIQLTIFNERIPQVNSIKILGIHYTANISFLCHFQYLKKKCLIKINALRCISSTQWGSRTYHLIQIVNAAIRSILEYGSPILFSAPKSHLRVIETIYNSSLRSATGLQRWTLIHILHKEAGTTSISLRLVLAAKKFYLRHCSLGSHSPINRLLHKFHFTRLKKKPHLFLKFQDIFNQKGISKFNFIPFNIPVFLTDLPNLCLFVHDLPFQTTKNPNEILPLYQETLQTLWKDLVILATDASKSSPNTGIAAINSRNNMSYISQIHPINSVFTREVLAIWLAVTKFTTEYLDYVILSDSKSAITALISATHKSPHSILLLQNKIVSASAKVKSITIARTLARVDISPNETADKLAKHATNAPRAIPFISPEDLSYSAVFDSNRELSNLWINSKYHKRFPFVHPVNKTSVNQLPNRKYDILISLLRSNTIQLNEIYAKIGLVDSPLCDHCQHPESAIHLLFECKKFDIRDKHCVRQSEFSHSPSTVFLVMTNMIIFSKT
ncbi:uncharacterized protein [Parasteatoda tepidariorum]|uniref:uncharacterized protein n=1 Tax=Parasteatoda tepidariorum TaxID=114398 RepID=UPI00077FB66F|nr:uncharacterized protein LOC107437011 [Parasteatoda tepidariorum]